VPDLLYPIQIVAVKKRLAEYIQYAKAEIKDPDIKAAHAAAAKPGRTAFNKADLCQSSLFVQKNLYEKISSFSRSADVGYVKFIFRMLINSCQSVFFNYFSHISFGFLLDLYRISERNPKEI
jgi:hypothetical protein